MNNIIDCRGLNCPMPVINTKKHLEGMESGVATTIVDNEVAKNNVVKLVSNLGCEYEVKENQGLYEIKITKGTCENNSVDESKTSNSNESLTVAIGADVMGQGEEELGKILIKGYIFALSEAEVVPKDLIFFNSGVKLTVEGSNVIDSLKNLEEKGCKIQVCGTCLDFYNVKDKILIGEISNMYSIVETMNSAGKVINI